MKPRIVEISEGEFRTVCHGCGVVIPQRTLWCDNCRDTKGVFCAMCGKPSQTKVCRECQVGLPKILTREDRAVVEELWEESLTAPEIAKRLGIRTKHPGTMISKARRWGWDLPYRKPDSVEHMRNVARKSNWRKKKAATKRMRRIPETQDKQSATERMWAEGFTAREICENMGWSTRYPGTAIRKARNRGWNLPYRMPGMSESARIKVEAFNAEKKG